MTKSMKALMQNNSITQTHNINFCKKYIDETSTIVAQKKYKNGDHEYIFYAPSYYVESFMEKNEKYFKQLEKERWSVYY